MIKKLLGIAPSKIGDNIYKPSPLSLKLGTSDKTNYSHTNYHKSYNEDQFKVLMICTEEKHLEMANGKMFLTGNHPVEMFVPLLHFEKAGFKTDVFTPTGLPAKIEMWAMPKKDQAVNKIFSKYKSELDDPRSLKYFVENKMSSTDEYIGIFIPGGHGALLGLPENKDLKALTHWAFDNNLLIFSICHGPAALLSANIGETEEDFIFKGYSIAAFPDSVDDKTPMIGYLPGKLKWYFGERLKSLGVNIINQKADDTCYKDRNLITAASPQAANSFGELGAQALLRRVKELL
ncbi:MAG TPA: DJ-1/PfpI family protein [Clostridia bacterium]|nr:DJ-1/PfpI family protein [Clostridia bacterium]